MIESTATPYLEDERRQRIIKHVRLRRGRGRHAGRAGRPRARRRAEFSVSRVLGGHRHGGGRWRPARRRGRGSAYPVEHGDADARHAVQLEWTPGDGGAAKGAAGEADRRALVLSEGGLKL